jgi:hypothetical protein
VRSKDPDERDANIVRPTGKFPEKNGNMTILGGVSQPDFDRNAGGRVRFPQLDEQFPHVILRREGQDEKDRDHA